MTDPTIIEGFDISGSITFPTLEFNPLNARIAILLPNLAGGGAEHVNIWLAKEFLKRGFCVEFVLLQKTGELVDLIPEGAEIYDLRAVRFRSAILPLVKYMRNRKPGAVIANMWPLTSVAVLAHRLARARCRLLVSEHCTLSHHEGKRGLMHNIALRASLASTYRLADERVAVSAGVASDLALLSGIRRDRFEVVYNPIPAPMFTDKNEAEEVWGGWTGKRVISVGALKPEKNYTVLIEAFSRLLRKQDAKLLLLGDGPLRCELELQIADRGLEGKVLMPGFRINPVPFYRSADLFVLSSDYEGFGNVIVEALACGLPVVSTDCPGGPAEILDFGRFGALVSCGDPKALADAMFEMLNQSHDRMALMDRAADFLPHLAADKYLRLLFPKADTNGCYY